MLRYLVLLLLLCLSTPLAADTLYQRLGGQPALQAITDQLIDVASTDPNTKRSFHRVNLQRVKEKLAEQFCVLAGGPCTYTGDDMRLVHRGLQITEREFYGLVEQLRTILDARGVGSREKNELLALLAPMKPHVVDPVAAGP
ncbi:MAG: group I truncated hemoglobin [Pseudomonadota bacterium]